MALSFDIFRVVATHQFVEPVDARGLTKEGGSIFDGQESIPLMKYGVLFSTTAILLLVTAARNGGWAALSVWPALSFAIVAVGYFFVGPRVYGKSTAGELSWFNSVLLLPYLLCLRFVWHAVQLVKTEPAYDQLTDQIYIGRRLLAREFPANIDHVVDLTCEFDEPRRVRAVDYHSMQILDGFVPTIQQLQSWVAKVAEFEGTVYIHCAEGHGRTGLFATALLVQLGQYSCTTEALKFVQSRRPRVRLSSRQHKSLAAFQVL